MESSVQNRQAAQESERVTNHSHEVLNQLDRPFRIIAFDWDGTAVPDRHSDASAATEVMRELLKLGVSIAIITGTNFKNIDNQSTHLIEGPHKQNLFVLTNRGSEVFSFDESSKPKLIYRRQATDGENGLLSKVADGVRDRIEHDGGPKIEIVYDRLNRRKIDMIPEPEWADPPKARIGELLKATEHRLRTHGVTGGIREVFELTETLAADFGLKSARITTDVKFVEVGLTDKSDSVRWVIQELAPRVGVEVQSILFLGDEFGPIAGFDGSDFKMITDEAKASTFVSVGLEPNGVPGRVLHVGGGPERFVDLMRRQIALHRGGSETRVPIGSAS